MCFHSTLSSLLTIFNKISYAHYSQIRILLSYTHHFFFFYSHLLILLSLPTTIEKRLSLSILGTIGHLGTRRMLA